MAVQYSIQKMVSDGTLSTIVLGIQYLQRNDIYMRIAGEETPQSGAPSGYTWSFLDNTTLKILPAVPNGVEVVVYRRTDVDAMYNIYSQNAQFDEATIDENNQQLLYIAQEYLEQGLPGTGIDTIEYVRDDGSFTYYRLRRTDGSYSEEFTVPSASNSTKVLTRGSLRRSYAEAGYNLVDGSFEVGGVLVNANDVLLHEASGKAFSGLAGTVAAGTDPASGGFVDVSDQIHRTALPIVSPTEKRFAGGADPTGVADSTDALQACIDYCAPFEWKGSVAATKAAMGAVVAVIGGFGKFRITRPLKINPFLVIDVPHNGAFFGGNRGFQIIADFDDKDNFALDTAPYNSSGVRVLGRKAGRGDWDNGLYTGCPGWILRGVEVKVATGRNLRGTLNRCMAQQSHVTYCSLEGANIGIQNSVSWGGSVRFNHIVARAIPMFNSSDLTVDEQQANYLTVGGTKPVSGTEFTYPTWSEPTLQGKTTPVYCEYAHPNFFHNILEGGQIAAMVTNQSSINLDQNYVEGAGYEYVYAGHTVSLRISPRWVIAANAGLLWLDTCTVELDASAISYLNVADWGFIDSSSKVTVTGSKTGIIHYMPWNKFIDYADVDYKGVLNIYVSESGNDSDSGYSSSKPVLTLQEAFDRCKSGYFNRINVSGSVGTKYEYTTGGNTTNKIMNLDIVEINGGGSGSLTIGQSFNQLHSIPMGISKVKLKGLSSVSIATIADEYRPFIPCAGVVNIDVDGGTYSGGVFMGVKFGYAGMANLVVRNATMSCELQHSARQDNAFSWIDTALNTSVSGGIVGSIESKKISSVLYP